MRGRVAILILVFAGCASETPDTSSPLSDGENGDAAVMHDFSTTASTERFSSVIVDAESTYYGTYASHNRPTVSNAYGIFAAHLQTPGASATYVWRVLRSTDGGKTFSILDERTHGTVPPNLATDSAGNLYLGHTDYATGNAFIRRYLARENFQPRAEPWAVIPGVGGLAKWSMVLDVPRRQLYWFTSAKFSVVDMDTGSEKWSFAPLVTRARGSTLVPEYFNTYLDVDGTLYTAWSTCDASVSPCRFVSIHFMLSSDGGRTWKTPRGDTLVPPIVCDASGPATRVDRDDDPSMEVSLDSLLVKGRMVHFLYHANSRPTRYMHYVRFDLERLLFDRSVAPVVGDQLSVRHTGFFASSISVGEIYMVASQPESLGVSWTRPFQVVVLRSDDNGMTWRDYAAGRDLRPGLPFHVSGSQVLDQRGYIVGVHNTAFVLPDQTKRHQVEFFQVKAESSLVRGSYPFTVGDREGSHTYADFDEFGSAAAAPTHVVRQTSLSDVRAWIGFSYNDPNRTPKSQSLQLTGLVPGRQYTFYVQPMMVANDGHCFRAIARQGAAIFEGACKTWRGQSATRPDRWKIVFNATESTATIWLGSSFNADNSRDVSRYLYLDAIYGQ